MGFFKDIFKGGAEGLIDGLGNTVDRFVITAEEKKEFELAKQKMRLDFLEMEMKADQMIYEDMKSARNMAETDPMTPRILTLLFTVGYFGITVFMFSFFMRLIDVELDNFVVSFISSIFGAFNAIMVQIISFYFGSSKGGEDQKMKIDYDINKAAKDRQNG